MHSILIDGYNLMHVTDLFGQGDQAGTLEGSRNALLAFLAAKLSPRERGRTRIVFDAAGAPLGLPNEYRCEGICVSFARDYPDADAMLEALIAKIKAPKELLVVSGDRRVQRAARSRGAAWIDSSEWYREVGRRGESDEDPQSAASGKASVGDVAYWVRQFSEEPIEPTERDVVKPATPLPTESVLPAENMFPPGYAQDLAEEWERSHPTRQEPGSEAPPDAPPQSS